MQPPPGRSSEKEPIAIVGMACRFPGADDLDAYWTMISTGASGIAELPPERLDRELYYCPDQGVTGRTYSTLGGVVPDRPVDRGVCPIPDDLLPHVDVAHQTIAEVAARALRDGGDPARWHDRNVGVYIGHSGGSTLAGEMAWSVSIEQITEILAGGEEFRRLDAAQQEEVVRTIIERVRAEHPARRPDGGPDLAANMAAQVISQTFGLQGPSYVIDAACASSLIALALGVHALRTGAIEAAVVGGASYNKWYGCVLFSQAQSMSPTGSRPFDADADGLIASDGYGVLVLKTLDAAEADGDRILGVIRSVGVSSDGKGKSLWAPRAEGQVVAIERAYGDAIDPATVQYLECHATSTQVGDATELSALAMSLAPKLPKGVKIPIGSVKANVGHTLESAGIAGLIKTLLCLKHRQIPGQINVRRLNPDVPWDELPFEVSRQSRPWPAPADGGPRRAAVNAFGIGGLNVHVVVDEAPAARPAPTRLTPRPRSQPPLAVIGRGALLPGALSVGAFWDLLSSGTSAIGDIDPARWNPAVYFDPTAPRPYRSMSKRAGQLRGYAYDWKKHKVAPKQVANANPLQFMLLDAADQALQDAGFAAGAFDRKRTAAVVGSIFGGDFACAMQMGLRIPEFQQLMRDELRRRGVPRDRVERLAQEFEESLLERMPALLDETGSFTASTLASRLTKSFDLMGGALALDAGDVSSLAAISAAAGMLADGDVETVLCAAGQRSLDVNVYEQLSLRGRLGGECPATPALAEGDGTWVPGEGVVVLLLKRLDAAERDGNRIHGILRGFGTAFDRSFAAGQRRSIVAGLKGSALGSENMGRVELARWKTADADLGTTTALRETCVTAERRHPLLVGSMAQQTGHLLGASGMAAVLKLVLELEHGRAVGTPATPRAALRGESHLKVPTAPEPLFATMPNGHAAGIVLNSTDSGAVMSLVVEGTRSLPKPPTPSTPNTSRPMPASSPIPAASHTTSSTWRKFSWAASDDGGLVAALRASLYAAESAFEGDAAATKTAGVCRLSIVADRPETLAQRLRLALHHLEQGQPLTGLGGQGVFFSRLESPPLRALLFPGQGSQYAGMLRERVARSPRLQRCLHNVDAALARAGQPSFADFAWDRPERLGVDGTITQLSVLAADLLMFELLQEQGWQPDFVCGHSYGEISALVASGALSIDAAIQLSLARSQAIAETPSAAGTLLSVRGSAAECEPVLAKFPGQLYLACENSSDQVVLGGGRGVLKEAQKVCDTLRMPNRLLNVPAPYHTPLLNEVREKFATAIESMRIEAPRIPFLSSVTNDVVSDPADIRRALIDQLVVPVRFVALVRRLRSLGAGLFVEVGPQQTLTQLTQRIVSEETGDRVPPVLVATDYPRLTADEADLRLDAASAVAGVRPVAEEAAPVAAAAAPPPSAAPVRRGNIHRFDATAKRRERNRAGAVTTNSAPRNGHSTPSDTSVVGHNGSSNGHGRLQSPRAIPLESSSPAKSATASFFVADPVPNTSRRPSRPAVDATPLTRFLTEFIVDQTGYPAEMVEPTADLEADLGIDSIKKAQMVGEAAEHFQLAHLAGSLRDVSLDDFRTIERIVHWIVQAGGEPDASPAVTTPADSGPAPVARKAVAASTNGHHADGEGHPAFAAGRAASSAVVEADEEAEAAPLATVALETAPTLDRSELESFLINFVVEQTGYPVEMVEPDADLEADLGIDSIKKAQMVGEVAEHFELSRLAGSLRDVSLDDFRTVRSISEWIVRASSGETDSDEAVATAEANTTEAETSPSADPNNATAVPVPEPVTRPDVTVLAERVSVTLPEGPDQKELEAFLVGFVVEQTGYPEEMVETEADLEADLGIDSIKKAQMVGEVAERYSLGHLAGSLREVSLDDFRSIASIAGWIASRATAAADDAETGEPGSEAELAARPSPDASVVRSGLPPESERVMRRFILRTVPAPLDAVGEFRPAGAALIVGSNPAAQAIRDAWPNGHAVHHWETIADPDTVVRDLQTLWQREPIAHLVIATPRDADAARPDADRLAAGLVGPYLLCQEWTRLVQEAGLESSATLLGLSSLDGDFGFSGSVTAPEGGGLTGLFKGIRREFPAIRVKVIDASPQESAGPLAAFALQELAARDPHLEVGYRRGTRSVVKALPLPASVQRPAVETPTGAWIVSGGARGVTAVVALELGRRFGLELHLLGSAPRREIDPEWRHLSDAGLREMKPAFMERARQRGENAAAAWKAFERDREIEQNLQRFQSAGVRATYHACDVSNPSQVAAVVGKIRARGTPITGILHGAGVESASRFHRKKRDLVEQTLRVKIGGAVTLLEATRNDPVRWLVGFGSTSGRFGGTGQTDYSMASDMLAKLCSSYRNRRPELSAVTFHWPPWGDVGMAARPESRIALQASNLAFMPPLEGAAHVVDELLGAMNEPEILLLDRGGPLDSDATIDEALTADAIEETSRLLATLPMIDAVDAWRDGRPSRVSCVVDPARERFLDEHRLDGAPILPAVMALELLCEGAALALGASAGPWTVEGFHIHHGCKLSAARPPALRVDLEREGSRVRARLTTDFRDRQGRLVEPGRLLAEATVGRADSLPAVDIAPATSAVPLRPTRFATSERDYDPRHDGSGYHGDVFHALAEIGEHDAGVEGRLLTPSPSDLSARRAGRDGWILPPAVLDGAFVATDLWSVHREGTLQLPERIDRLAVGEGPAPGEVLTLRSQRSLDERGESAWNWSVTNPRGRIVLTVEGYRPVRLTRRADGGKPVPTPALSPTDSLPPLLGRIVERQAGWLAAEVTFDPTRDRFLVEHRLDGRPLLPAVIGMEALVEAALAFEPGKHVQSLHDFRILRSLAFPTDDRVTVRVDVKREPGGLRARLVSATDPQTIYQTALVQVGDGPLAAEGVDPITPAPFPYNPMIYPEDQGLYHGPAFRKLERLFLQRDGGWAQVRGAAAGSLGDERSAGWALPAATLDACFVALGVDLFILMEQRKELPYACEELRLFRLPRPDELCTLRLYYRGQTERSSTYDFVLYGDQNEPVIAVRGYQGILLEPA